MGHSYTPKYRIEFRDHSGDHRQAWSVSDHGKPIEENIEKWVYAYVDSYKIGGVNEHVAKAIGYIPVTSRARIVNQWTSEIVATWVAPMFMVI